MWPAAWHTGACERNKTIKNQIKHSLADGKVHYIIISDSSTAMGIKGQYMRSTASGCAQGTMYAHLTGRPHAATTRAPSSASFSSLGISWERLLASPALSRAMRQLQQYGCVGISSTGAWASAVQHAAHTCALSPTAQNRQRGNCTSVPLLQCAVVKTCWYLACWRSARACMPAPLSASTLNTPAPYLSMVRKY